jgi:hypothetical protein
MLLLRIASRSRWAADRVEDDPAQVATAANDLKPLLDDPKSGR